MIKISIDPKYYKEIHNAINAVDNQVRLGFSKKGCETSVVDPSNIFMCELEIPKSVFESYIIDNDIQIGYELNLFDETKTKHPKLTQFLNSKTIHKFKIHIEPDVSVNSVITIANIKHDIFNSKIRLVDINYIRRKPQVPNMDLNCSITLKKDTIKKLLVYDDYIIFDVSHKDQSLVCSGFSDWYTQPIKVNTKEDAKAIYSSESLKSLISAMPKNVSEFNMDFKTDFPCKISFKICDDKVPVTYLLAPRIESE